MRCNPRTLWYSIESGRRLCQANNPILTRALISQVLLEVDEEYNVVVVTLQGDPLTIHHKVKVKVKVEEIISPMEIMVIVVDNLEGKAEAEDDIVQLTKFVEKTRHTADVYYNSDATNHVTANYPSLANPFEYGGKEQIAVANDDKLNIASIGH
ncbi:hypothetical protein E5676_scaffold307G00340 [Cucumis melo var. makuwa]|uniref:Uncharacterized protein n=1 Tax=Cucumis melo var. makuwa TaxID=1194695 RepID=A0A5D3D8B7_CUCMM|nr:hypothetical protein E5676_scaffold307G00340 [Cucumis melo var. makuwa]